jgi:hypothetical protein
MKINYLSFLTFLFLLQTSCASHSQSREKKIETKVLWAETYMGHYSDGSGNMVKGVGGLVSAIKPYDTITEINYEKGYYEINKNSYRRIPIYDSIANSDYSRNFDLYANYSSEMEKRIDSTKLLFNNVWQYELCNVTFEKYFVGDIEQFVPDFSTAKSDNLKYKKIKIPTYVIKLISIEPYYTE